MACLWFFGAAEFSRRAARKSLLICAGFATDQNAQNPMCSASARLVLYVEDDRINLVLMEEVFRRLPGWRLECAEDGAQALGMLASLRPDLLLIDMNLPDMSGLDLLMHLRKLVHGVGLHCVALSADDLPTQVEAARAAGFSDYWVKPIDVMKMVEALQRALP
jgi:CheY-like chemotaxis protein